MELRRTFEVLERVGEGIDAGLAVIGKDYRVIWANKRLMDLGVLPNKKCHQTFNRSEMVCVDCGAKKIFQQDIALDVHEFETVNSKGETTWIELRVTPLKDKNGKVEAALGLAVPITERKKAEQELKEKELKYYNIFNTSAVGMFRTRLDGSEIVDFNDKYLEIFGLVREEMRGLRSVMFWADPLERHRMVCLLQANGYVQDFECKLISKQHEIKTCLTSVKLYREQGILEGSIIDITEHKQAEAALLSSEEKFRKAFTTGSDAFVITTLNDSLIVEYNDAFLKMFGYSKEEVTGKRALELDIWADPSERKMISLILKSEEKVNNKESLYRRKNGEIFPALYSAALMSINDEQLVLITARDISNTKEDRICVKRKREEVPFSF